ncbi:MAG: apolipoprotein N-acyltransferase [Methylophilus sp.]|nr:apolipoprotein N-acyltransferase [Methylophilus sp.]
MNKDFLFAFVAGVVAVFGFAPYYIWLAPILSLVALFYLWHRSSHAKQSFQIGFSFGLGLYGFGIYWIYICLHDFGGMPWWFAGFCTLCLCAFMALFPALVAYLSRRLGCVVWSAPVIWALSDWVRSWIFTGFPWLTLGYSQVPFGPLVGYLPIVGVYGVSVITALIASLIAYWIANRNLSVLWQRNIIIGVTFFIVVGLVLKPVEWSSPDGKPIQVALVQGNINQEIKWSPEYAQSTIDLYLSMVKSTHADLIVLPETALPVIASQLSPEVTQALTQHAKQNEGDIVMGVVQYDERTNEYFNSAISYGSAPSQVYSKNHLVPFGEFIPLKAILGWVYRDWLNMPLSDLSRGGKHQKPMQLGNQKVAMNICYEDVFGEEIIRQLPEATMLVNISNDAWYGKSFAANQHMQFSQARAIETGRMVLRATNTGATVIIDQHGMELAHAPHDTQMTLTGAAQGFSGETPYVRWGNWPFIIMSVWSISLLLRKKILRNNK